MTWSDAFLRQAVSDYQMFKRLSDKRSDAAICHRLQFLQMATEKLAKSFLISDSSSKASRFAAVASIR